MHIKFAVDVVVSRRQKVAGALALFASVFFINAFVQAEIEDFEPGETLTAARLNEIKDHSVPPGMISSFGGTVAPEGWFLCDGAAVSRTDNAELFSAIGVTFGVGNSVDTFNLPDLRGRMVIGSGEGTGLTAREPGASGGAESTTLSINQLPPHGHGIVDPGHSHAVVDPGHAHTPSNALSFLTGGGSGNAQLALGSGFNFATSTSSNVTNLSVSGATTGITATQQAGGGQSVPRMQPFAVAMAIIKR